MKKVAVTQVDKNEFFSDEKELIINVAHWQSLRISSFCRPWESDVHAFRSDVRHVDLAPLASSFELPL